MPALKLLVVEDDMVSLELMSEVFKSLRAEVRPINHSEEAAELIEQEKFDGIFLDLEMPRMHGFDLARRIRESSRNRSTPIIVVTGREDRRTMQQAFETGANFFLQKPIDRQKLTKLFRSARGTLVENRRNSLRVPLQREVTIELASRTMKGVTWNLSLGGMQLEAEGLKMGDVARLSFGLPGAVGPIDVEGTVVWMTDNRQGIKFGKVAPPSQQAILKFVAEAELQSMAREEN